MVHYASADAETITDAVRWACTAPSVHNVQPWSWRLQRGTLELRVDRLRSIPVEDPAGRQSIISCGAALHHLRVTLEHNLIEPIVANFPDRGQPDLLAVITFRGRPRAMSSEAALFASLERRRSDRRPFDAPPLGSLVNLAQHASVFGVSAISLSKRFAGMLDRAATLSAEQHHSDPAYWNELESWIRPTPTADGLPRGVLPDALSVHESASARGFPSGHLRIGYGVGDDAALMLLSSVADLPMDWLNVGQAMSSLLLHATASHLATCPLTHLTEVDSSREIVRDVASRSGETLQYPQVMIRVGVQRNPSATAHDAGTSEVGVGEHRPEETGRRPLDEVLTVSS
ncbi:Acg family FMN-binding oxidoreductase [Rhodococcus qingshengii]|uniref:Acg family FMN-binding oxidoreductase n=1 Tax=Rhodococcus qingshengii TaxID=334542 RepID=UPI003F4D6D82